MEVSELFYTFALPNSNYMDELQNIQNLIYVIRGQRVMLDFDLAMLYEVETRSLNQTVKRNARRFPDDFMFQLTEQEWSLISSQFVMTSRMKRPKKSLPYAFTELGALMLSKSLAVPLVLFSQKTRRIPNFLVSLCQRTLARRFFFRAFLYRFVLYVNLSCHHISD